MKKIIVIAAVLLGVVVVIGLRSCGDDAVAEGDTATSTVSLGFAPADDPVDEEEAPKPPEGEPRDVRPASEADPVDPLRKVFAVTLRLDKEGVAELSEPRIFYGSAPNNIGTPELFMLELIGFDGTVLAEVPAWDPRWVNVWSEEDDRDPIDLLDEAEAAIMTRYVPGLATARVLQNDETLAEIDLGKVVREFCAKNPNDPTCDETGEPGSEIEP